MSLLIYVDAVRDQPIFFQSHWEQWVKEHYPQWNFVGVDNHSDSFYLSCIQKATVEHTNTCVLIEFVKGEANAFNKLIPFLQKLTKNSSSQYSLLLLGENSVIEKVGKMLYRFEQAKTQEEAKRKLHRLLSLERE